MKRVAVYYSVGPHFRKALESARGLGEHVIAIMPPDLDDGGLADETVRTEYAHYSPRMISSNMRLIRQIRGEKLDSFVVLFDSPQLRLLASLTGVGERWYCAPHGRVTPLNDSPAGIVILECIRRIRGWTRYIWLSAYVRLTKVSVDRKEAPRR